MELQTSGASNRIIPILQAFRTLLICVRSVLFYVVLLVFRGRSPPILIDLEPRSPRKSSKLRYPWRREEEDTLCRRRLAKSADVTGSTALFLSSGTRVLFYRFWFPDTPEINLIICRYRAILIIIHGLNEHSGRYAHFAKQLTSTNFAVYAMDLIGHGGSDGLHGYVPSLDHVVADICNFLEKVKLDNPGIPCFLFGHSTGGAVVLKAALLPGMGEMIRGVILTSPALRVKPRHPIVTAVAPIISVVIPKFQFKGANRRGIPVSRDPAALLAKYSDPLVYTGPMRVRTGYEILRISSFLFHNLRSVSVPFFVLHGTADEVTDPMASRDLYLHAVSLFKEIKLYHGFLHDLLFEPERDEIAEDIIRWMIKRLDCKNMTPTVP